MWIRKLSHFRSGVGGRVISFQDDRKGTMTTIWKARRKRTYQLQIHFIWSFITIADSALLLIALFYFIPIHQIFTNRTYNSNAVFTFISTFNYSEIVSNKLCWLKLVDFLERPGLLLKFVNIVNLSFANYKIIAACVFYLHQFRRKCLFRQINWTWREDVWYKSSLNEWEPTPEIFRRK